MVMHSIVDSLINNTGRAINKKLGDFLSNNTGTNTALNTKLTF